MYRIISIPFFIFYEADKIPATHSRAKMDMQYNEPSNVVEKRKQKRQARREYRRYLKEDLKRKTSRQVFGMDYRRKNAFFN